MKYNSFSRVRSGYKGIKFHLYIYYLFCAILKLLMPRGVRHKVKNYTGKDSLHILPNGFLSPVGVPF